MSRKTYVARVKRRFLRLVDAGKDVSIAEAARGISKPKNLDARCLGSIPRALKKAGLIIEAGFSRSETSGQNAGIVRLWRAASQKKKPATE